MRELGGFLREFVRPLVEGGDVHVGDPIGRDVLDVWEVAIGEHAETTVAIDEARARIAAGLVVRPPPLAFGPADLRLAVALYDALVLSHPQTEGWPARRGRRGLATFVGDLLADAGSPDGRIDVVSRHTLLHGLPDLVRVDTRLRWWTGKAEFKGAPPPRRLMVWPTVRRVKEEKAEVPLTDVVDGEAAPLVGELLARSPLTDLLAAGLPARGFTPYRWGGQLEVLRDAELARLVAYRWLAGPRDVEPAAQLRAPAAASAAWEQALATPLELVPRRTAEGAAKVAVLLPRVRSSLPAADLRAATAFLVHVGALVALGESLQPDLDAPSPVVAAALGAKRAGEAADPALGLRLFFAVPDAAIRVDAALGRPPGIDDDRRLARRWAAHRAQVRAALGEERLAQLARRLAVALG